MSSSLTKLTSSCKSRISAIARSCFLSREHWREKYREAQREKDECLGVLADREARGLRLERENADLRQRIAELQAELATPRPVQLPLGDVPRGQQYGANRMALSVNLARAVGVRAAARAEKIFFATGWASR